MDVYVPLKKGIGNKMFILLVIGSVILGIKSMLFILAWAWLDS